VHPVYHPIAEGRGPDTCANQDWAIAAGASVRKSTQVPRVQTVRCSPATLRRRGLRCGSERMSTGSGYTTMHSHADGPRGFAATWIRHDKSVRRFETWGSNAPRRRQIL